MKTIVSVTPLPVSADTRTFKIAASFARFGYRSIVVEGEKSDVEPVGLPFELCSIKSFPATTGRSLLTHSKANFKKERYLKQWLKDWINGQPGQFQKVLRKFLHIQYYIKNYVLHPINAIPSADLYYLHAPYQFAAVYWASRFGAIPFIYDAHDFYPVVNPNAFYKRLESWCTRKATAVVTVSEGVASLMNREFGCQPVILQNCQDERLERSRAEGIRSALRLSKDDFCLLSVGNAKVGQGVVEALKALRGLPSSVHVAFLGRDYEQYQHVIDKMRLRGRVHILPPVRADEVVPFIRSADASLILYFPSDVNYENALPNKFFQAVSAELPLIYPELPEIKKLAEQYGLGISVDTQSPESIRTAVMQLLKQQDTVSRIKKNLREARAALSWEQEEEVLFDLVEWVMRKPGCN